MFYYQKYLKYKTKYLNLLKGGIVPQIDGDLLPFENKNINIIYQGRIILKNNDDIKNNYLLNDNYELEKKNIIINKQLFQTSEQSFLINLNVKLGNDYIPFHIGSLQSNFNIIIGIIEFIRYKPNSNIIKKFDTNGNIRKEFYQYLCTKIFFINEENIFVGISNKNSILNCFSFFNKLHEFLNYLLLNKYNKHTFDELFPNIKNIEDFYNIYSFYYKEKNKECTIKNYSQSSKDTFYKDIILFENFIYNCNKIDELIKFKLTFHISLINLILINWIYLRSLRTNLIVGSLSSNLYPINKINFYENIFQMNEEKIYCYIKQQKQFSKQDDINKLLLERIEIPIIPYNESTYNGHVFPNCVENTLLQLLKILSWKNNKYDIDLLPKGINKEFIDIIERINSEPLKIETDKIMNDFVALVSKVMHIEYRFGDHNIKSLPINVGNILNYIFNGETLKEGIKDYNKLIFEKINSNTDEYTLEQQDNLIIIDKNNFKINIIINEGHTSIDNKNNKIYNLIETYKYLDILYILNYTKDDSINFSEKFVNFCKKLNPEIKNFITNKVIKIQKISLIKRNSKDAIGNTCLHIASMFDNITKINEYKNLADIDNDNLYGETPLIIACNYFNYKSVNLLITNKANVNYHTISGETPLTRILRYNQIESDELIECVKFLIKNGVNINSANCQNTTPLLVASAYGNIECVKLLINNGADINHVNERGDTPLLEASKYGELDVIKYLINKSADITINNNENSTALSLASSNNKVDCIEFLISKGFNVNHINNNGNTPLSLASTNGNINCIKLLIKNHANVNCRNNYGVSPLSLASSGGHAESVKFLIDNKANLNNIDNNKDTPLSWAAIKGNFDCLKLLIDNGADINPINDDDDTPILLASYNCKIDCIKLLIENSADINHPNKGGNTPLLIASKKGHSECLKLFIEKGSDVNRANNDNNTALLLASKDGHVECVKLLVKEDIVIDHINDDGDTSLFLAATYGHYECLKLLYEKGANINYTNDDNDTPLLWACHYGHNDCVEFLIKKGADVNITNNIGQSALIYASINGNLTCVKLLIENYANINHVNENLDTPLTLASSYGNTNCIKYLIDNGSQVNHVNKNGNTSLILATNNGNLKCIKLLLDMGSKVNHENKNGYTALIFASLKGYVKCIELLIKYGANVNHTTKKNKTPLSIAKEKGYSECVKLLEESCAYK